MKKIAFLLIFLLLASTSITYGEPKAKKKKPVATSTKKESGEPSQKETQKYTAIQIDMSLDRLPPNYYGNDPKETYLSIQKRKGSAKKGEFETTEQFQKRVENENGQPIIGKISTEGQFAFLANRPDIKYSADASEFNIDIALKKVSEPLGYGLAKLKNPTYKSDSYNENAKAVMLTFDKVQSRSYTASNSYGATTTVEERNYEGCEAAISNYNEFPFTETISEHALQRAREMERILGSSYRRDSYISDYDKEMRISSKLKATPDEAKAIKASIKVLLIGKLDQPLVSESFFHSKPTMDSPSESTHITRYVYMKLSEIWIYNQSTGQIYSKIKRLEK